MSIVLCNFRYFFLFTLIIIMSGCFHENENLLNCNKEKELFENKNVIAISLDTVKCFSSIVSNSIFNRKDDFTIGFVFNIQDTSFIPNINKDLNIVIPSIKIWNNFRCCHQINRFQNFLDIEFINNDSIKIIYSKKHDILISKMNDARIKKVLKEVTNSYIDNYFNKSSTNENFRYDFIINIEFINDSIDMKTILTPIIKTCICEYIKIMRKNIQKKYSKKICKLEDKIFNRIKEDISFGIYISPVQIIRKQIQFKLPQKIKFSY